MRSSGNGLGGSRWAGRILWFWRESSEGGARSDPVGWPRSKTKTFPLSRCELLGRESRFLERLATDGFQWRRTDRLGDGIAEIVTVVDRDGVEVDLVLEFGPTKIAAVEVKLSATVRPRDFRGIKKIQSAVGERFTQGVVLYDGEDVIPFGDGLNAVPIGFLWDDPIEASG